MVSHPSPGTTSHGNENHVCHDHNCNNHDTLCSPRVLLVLEFWPTAMFRVARWQFDLSPSRWLAPHPNFELPAAHDLSVTKPVPIQLLAVKDSAPNVDVLGRGIVSNQRKSLCTRDRVEVDGRVWEMRAGKEIKILASDRKEAESCEDVPGSHRTMEGVRKKKKKEKASASESASQITIIIMNTNVNANVANWRITHPLSSLPGMPFLPELKFFRTNLRVSFAVLSGLA